ncbi:LLM class flavin-dependent oxidoreductase [Nakamurella multipartita]|uniref:Luciferase-like monooxygenase n=1 Tax=Nakamurella multipartita (strain ATCC 700099 / DSM 44233 / CIP 104796 / JCM 9543 / NBRC 105858 / Y-104) TaxID=479431 RepID=C8X783_NAKMY|nr:LLM class flavin-dependent oxidoreductase [Nakamurella multipartita]ACV76952.1 Luciferase-like monooxygenase [Nakamurella multipartita DSM 44233]
MQLGVYSFGDIHPNPVTHEKVSPAQRMADLLERIRLAEQVGLDFFGIGEHHRPDYAVSAPATVLAAAAGQTSRIGLGSAVTVLSTEDPVRVYQQYATIDLISRGRVELMAGRGSFIESYPLFGAELSDYDALYDEKIQLLLQIDAGNPVTWSGQFRPRLDKAVILPRPYPKPELGEHLRISVATGGNPESSVRAGLLGLPVNYAIIGGQPARFAPLVDLYRRACAQSERRGAVPQVAVSGMGFISDDGRALDTFFPYWFDSMRRIARERRFPAPDRASYEAQAAPGGAYFIGTPEQVAERIVTLHGVLGHDRQLFQMDLSSVPQADSLRAIELLGTAVVPLVRAEIGTA